jgi:hypothetical protein
VDAVKAAAEKSVAERYLLRADADRLVAEAAASDVLAEKPREPVALPPVTRSRRR